MNKSMVCDLFSLLLNRNRTNGNVDELNWNKNGKLSNFDGLEWTVGSVRDF